MATFLFDDNSSSSSEHNAFDYEYITPVRKKVYRKIFDDDIIDVEMEKDVNDIDDIDGKSFDGYGNESTRKGKEKVSIDIESDEDDGDFEDECDEDDFVEDEDDDDEYDCNVEDDEYDCNVEDDHVENINDVVPCIDMKFDDLDEAEKFYRDYGRSVGFEIIIRSTHRRSRSNMITSRLYICRKGGRLGSHVKDFEDGGKAKRPRDVIPRTKCQARMCVRHNMKTDKWEVSSVELSHNHDMVTADKVQFLQRSKNITPMARSLIELFNKSGIETPKVLKLLGDTCGGVEKLGYSSQDIRNVIRDIRRQVFDSGDAECGVLLLEELKKANVGNFFYKVDVDEDNRVRGLVWIDPRSFNAYKNFGDVVTFDSTYRTNRYCMPFIPITGVNHHYQNILFGFALIRDEKETSYKWVLNTWLEAMDNNYPTTIITDQDIALGNAIAEVMPHTRHTYCTWHISNKFPEKLSSLYSRFPNFKRDFNECVFKSLSPPEFEGKWATLVDNYDLQDHVWLNEMYEIRIQWIKAFTKTFFAAGMSTTSRSESMNSFFDEYVKTSTGLKEFIENSQKALEAQYLREVGADYETIYMERRLLTTSPLEKHASMLYTKEMFRRFQDEHKRSGCYIVKKAKDMGSYYHKVYFVENTTVPEGIRRKYAMEVSVDGMIWCACKKFEFSGMICRHIIRYLEKKQKTHIPQHFITLRWTMNGNKVAGPLPYHPPVHGNVDDSQPARYSSLCQAFQSLGAIGSCSKPRYNYVLNSIERDKQYIEDSFPEEERKQTMDEPYHFNEGDPILDPPMSTTKGRPKSGRFKSGIEMSTSKKARTCGKCKMSGVNHDRRNCPNKTP